MEFVKTEKKCYKENLIVRQSYLKIFKKNVYDMFITKLKLPWIFSLSLVMFERAPKQPHDRTRMIPKSSFRLNSLKCLYL